MIPFAVADCETDPFRYGLQVRAFLWGYFDGRIYRKFSTTEEFVSFARRQPRVIYAHNGGKFDWRQIEQHLDPGPVKFIGGRIAEARMGAAILRDSYSLLPGSLDSITGAKTAIDYRKFTAARRGAHMDEISEYLHNDVMQLYGALERFQGEYGRPLTLAGAALRHARGMGYEIPRMGPSHFDRFEKFYHGGRCEAIKPGTHKGRFYFLDINSAYAHAMSHDQHHGAAINTRKVAARHYSRALFHVEADSLGAFPVRGEGGGLSFPEGRGEFWITGRELATACDLKLARRVKILHAHRFETVSNFGRYVAEFQQKRREAKKAGDKLGDSMAKLFGNGFYGKLAANPHKYKNWHLTRLGERPADYAKHPYGFKIVRDLATGKPRKVEWGYQLIATLTDRDLWGYPLEDWQKTFYDVVLAAQITGHVRSIMLKARAAVREPLYCDTDSLICSSPGKLKLGDDLGQWKIESMGSEVIIAGKKLYAFRHDNAQRKKHGLPKSREQFKVASKGAKLTAEQLRRLAHGEAITYKQAAQSYGIHGARNVKRVIRATAQPRDCMKGGKGR